MDTLNRHSAFDPLDLEIVDRVYEVACAYIEARDLYRDTKNDAEGADALRKRVFALAGSAGTGPLDFDALCDKVLGGMVEDKTMSRAA
jgi:hypothetical protein